MEILRVDAYVDGMDEEEVEMEELVEGTLAEDEVDELLALEVDAAELRNAEYGKYGEY